MEVKEQLIALLVKNKPDVIARIAGILTGRGFSIEHICSHVTPDPDIAKLTLTTRGNTATTIKVEKQLKKLIDIIDVTYLREGETVQREMLLMKLGCSDENKEQIIKTAKDEGGRIISLNRDTCTIEATGTKAEIDHIISLFNSFDVKDMSRSGIVTV